MVRSSGTRAGPSSCTPVAGSRKPSLRSCVPPTRVGADRRAPGQRQSGDLRFASIHACTSVSSHSRTRACRTFGSGKLGRRESWSARVRETPSMSATSLIPTSAMAPKHKASSKDSISRDSAAELSESSGCVTPLGCGAEGNLGTAAHDGRLRAQCWIRARISSRPRGLRAGQSPPIVRAAPSLSASLRVSSAWRSGVADPLAIILA
jgi:hypothetical protein